MNEVFESDSGGREILADLLISGTNQPPEPPVIVPTPKKGVYDIVNSPLGTKYVRLGELIQSGPEDSYLDRC